MFYDRQYIQPDPFGDTMGFEWSSLLGPGISSGVGLLTGWLQDRSQPSGGRICLNGQVSGDEAMGNCVPVVMNLFNDLETRLAYGEISAADAVIAANNIAGIFSDNRYFNQEIGGRSQQIREAAKAQARQRADAIIATVNAMLQQQQPATGGTPTATQPAASEFDPKWIIAGGAAVLVAVLLIK